MTFNAQDFKCRCSAIHAIMANSRDNPVLTEKQAEELKTLENKVVLTETMKERMAELIVRRENGKKIILSDTCTDVLIEWHSWMYEGMLCLTREVLDIPQMQKGTVVEPESLKLLSEVDEKEYVANLLPDGSRQRVFNDYLSGEVDAYYGKSIMEAEIVPDIKSIFDHPTLYKKIEDKISLANDWQIKGYGDITGAKELFEANCLVDTPEYLIYDYYRMLLKKMSAVAVTEESPEFVEKWAILERSMKFSHIPAHRRVVKKKVEPMTKIQQQMVYDRVKVCRDWLFNFHSTYCNLNL